MEQHHESKASSIFGVTSQLHLTPPPQHAKLCAFDPEACTNMHEVHGGTTQGVQQACHSPRPCICLTVDAQVSLFVVAPSCK
jgi:hypothetical protein